MEEQLTFVTQKLDDDEVATKGFTMAEKSPQSKSSKKVGKTLKEKRTAKIDKRSSKNGLKSDK